jgi:cellulose biosynthesis protein BcsQ
VNIPVIAFFNNKGGVGKTSMVYHVSWMLADRGFRVIAADLDPQANLTAAFLDEDRLEEVLPIGDHPLTVFGAIQPLQCGVGDVGDPHIEIIDERLGLIVGDMELSTFEDQLSEVWPKCLDRDERSFRVISALWRVLQRAGQSHHADVILIDLGPNLGAINRTALIASDYVVIPLRPDLFSLQNLRNLGPALRRWREGWRGRLTRGLSEALTLPSGDMQPLGYIVLQHSIRLPPVSAFERWMARIPSTYVEAVLGKSAAISTTIDNDAHCIAKLRDYRSLIPLAQEARKPMFFLKPADGALGAIMYAVAQAYDDFRAVAEKIAKKASIKASRA